VLLPYLEQEALYGLYRQGIDMGQDLSKWPAGGRGAVFAQPASKVLRCPVDALPPDGVSQFFAPGENALYPQGQYFGLSSYGANWGTQKFPSSTSTPLKKDGAFHVNTRTRLTDFGDGTSQTILLGERSHHEPRWRLLYPTSLPSQNFASWGAWSNGLEFTSRQPLELRVQLRFRFSFGGNTPASVTMNWKLPASLDTGAPPSRSRAWNDLHYKRTGVYGSEHSGGANLAFGDGSVKFVRDGISLLTLRALCTRSGGEVISETY
jgi:prepilin-type processing-associated H-X9-DG protein